MQLIEYKNLTDEIKNTDYKKHIKKEYMFLILSNIISCIIIGIVSLIVQIDMNSLKIILKSTLGALILYDYTWFKTILPKIKQQIKQKIDVAENDLEWIIDFFHKHGIKTTIQNLKEAEISKTEIVKKEEVSEISGESKVLKATKESIKIKTIENEIITLKQYKLKIKLDQFLFRTHNFYYLYKDDEVTEKTEHTRKLTN